MILRLQNRSNNENFFSIRQGWLEDADPATVTAKLTDFVLELVELAKKEVGEVHGIVFPEAALTFELAESIAASVAKIETNFELFITGALKEVAPGHFLNLAIARTYDDGEPNFFWYQTKHHRWSINKGQIRQYHLGHVLDYKKSGGNKLMWTNVSVFSFTSDPRDFDVLICEDLARTDPVLPAINAVGPNLVIALLMDGPQLAQRWPARYATVLADDPGSSVLTLTSLGMARRSIMPGQNENRRVALWKQSGGSIEELGLSIGYHALALSLSASDQEQFTLDGRSDSSASQKFELTAVVSFGPHDPIPRLGLTKRFERITISIRTILGHRVMGANGYTGNEKSLLKQVDSVLKQILRRRRIGN